MTTKEEKNSERKISVRIPEALHERFRAKNVRPDHSMQQLLESLLDKWITGELIEHPPVTATEEEVLIVQGFLNWLRDAPRDRFWRAAISEWYERGQKIVEQHYDPKL